MNNYDDPSIAAETCSDGYLTHDTILDAFVEAVNVCEPEHPHHDDPYPITAEQVEQGFCQRTGRYYAKCGPRSYGRYLIGFSADRYAFSRKSNARVAAILVHELTHVTEGKHTPGSGHNKAFWREMVFNAQLLRDNMDALETILGPIDVAQFEYEVVHDPNSSMVDKRSETVAERKIENAELLGRDDLADELRDDA